MNKWRRQYKQRLHRSLKRFRAVRAAIGGALMTAAAVAAVARIQAIQATPAGSFQGGMVGKAAATAQAVIDGQRSILRAWDMVTVMLSGGPIARTPAPQGNLL